MGDEVVSHPGARPESIEFPFAAAHAVIAAIDVEIDDLVACAAGHESGAAQALFGAAGQSTTAFEQRLTTRLSDLALRRHHLREQQDEIQRQITLARDAVMARERAIDHWHIRMDAYREAS